MLSEFALYWYWFKNQQKKNKHALYLLNWTQLINKEQGYNWQKKPAKSNFDLMNMATNNSILVGQMKLLAC